MPERVLEWRARVYDHETRPVRVRLAEYDGRERVARAARAAGPFLLGALLSLPIPGWHFVGVPGCLIAAVWRGVGRLRTPREIVGLDGACPACDTPPALEAPLPLSESVVLRCAHCHEFINLEELR